MKFAKEAWPFVAPFLILAAVLAAYGRWGWAAACAVVAVAVLLFFRHPLRSYEGPVETLLAPADGVVLRVDRLEDEQIGPGELHRVVTFLSVFDVHTQRVPASGEVVLSVLERGAKLAAFRDDIDVRNERHTTVIRRPNGDLIGVRQLVGLVARRIVCYLQPGQQVERGQTLGLIKFGSRVDLLVPAHYEILVSKGQRLQSGLTPIATVPATVPAEAPATGEAVREPVP